jgi:hypothetical protein
VPALVGFLGTAETRNPDGDEDFSDYFSGDVRGSALGQRAYLSMAEALPEARRDRQRTDQVNKNMRETCGRKVGSPKRGLPHCRPQKPLGNQPDGGGGPGMAEAVEGVKHLASERRGYEWPRL